ncbi:MerR family transcriptional regulator [Mycobacterium sp. ACS1612]|uniref:MerR family transcriptional regulator n=1 Tax=Mycobacterium sp. ACS1612 TaxID=1834117 RepID=UPI001E294F41|nr:MerR family transcriptional regulator [Mycobacterium sp. ACS1612]
MVLQTPSAPGCAALAEYRLDDLARISGVSARNIRAYRERGLLDPPRRVGRSAYYDDYHLSQLKTINQLLRRGFTSAHIAEFFTSMRQGADLADILGIQRAVLGPRAGEPGAPAPSDPGAATLDVDSEEARKLIDCGLADVVDGELVLRDSEIGAIVARSTEPVLYARAIVRMFEATKDSIDDVAADLVHTLEALYESRFGARHVPKPEQLAEVSRIVLDYRDLGDKVVADRVREAVRARLVTAVSEFTAGILMSGDSTEQ